MPTILDGINSPQDLKGLSYPDLEKLAGELREEIIKTISINGGHLASSLGVIELTITLHRVFRSPEDKIIWDVGHQSYAHKLLTGRKDQFHTIRRYGGLSGFPSRAESPHDVFNTGHAGTSISAALGMALARDLNRENYHVIPVIGDGSLGTGMAFEAINHAGHLGTRLIVILNDNGMAISPTRGALSRLFNQVRSNYHYEKAKSRARKAAGYLPFGTKAWGLGKVAKKSFERVLLAHAFWEEMGFVYLGPLDGHDIRSMEAALLRARDYESGPVIIHVLTTKGKGYPVAEANAVDYHGISPHLNIKENGNSSYSRIFGQTMLRLMQENPKITAISAAMLEGTGLTEVAKEFPERVFDVGICEQHAVTLAAGLATQGYIPVVAIYSTFLQRSYDQIIHDICLQKLPVVFAVDRAGIVGEDGATHQGSYDLSYLLSIPNMIVSSPADELEFQNLLYTAVNIAQPMAIRYPRGEVDHITLSEQHTLYPVGKGEILTEGKHAAILAIGSMVRPALEAAGLLKRDNIDCTVVNARFAKPLDEKLILETACKIPRLITLEENTVMGGFGSNVIRLLTNSAQGLAQTLCLGLPDSFIGHGNADIIRSRYGLDPAGIAKRIKSAFPELLTVKSLIQPKRLED